MKSASHTTAYALLFALLFALPAHAQEGPKCPRLPDGSPLRWEEVRNPDLLFCKALDASGNPAFSVMLSRESPFRPVRGLREEATTINGKGTYWYRTEIANQPDVLARETSIELADGNIAYFNVQANSQEALQQSFAQISALGF